MSLNLIPFNTAGRIIDIDTSSDPVACSFSVRKTSTKYQGPCLRVRRDDGLEKDIGFKQTDIDIQAIVSFVGRGNGYVSIWYDQSGRGQHAKQSDYRKQPVIVQQGKVISDPLDKQISLRFDGNQYMDTPYEPSESDVYGSGMQMVVSYGTIDAGNVQTQQPGSVRVHGEWTIDNRVEVAYPLEDLTTGFDTLSFDSYDNLPGGRILYTTASQTYGVLRANVDYSEDKELVNPSLENTVTTIPAPLAGGDLTLKTLLKTDSANDDKFSDIIDVGNGNMVAVPSLERDVLWITSDGVKKILKSYNLPNVNGAMFSAAKQVGDYVYLIPYNYTYVVRFDTTQLQNYVDGTTSAAEIQVTTSPNSELFKDAVFSTINQSLYCIPFKSGIVFKVNTTSFSGTQIQISTSTGVKVNMPTTTNKFWTGAETSGKIVCPPYDALCSLVIDPVSDTATLVGSTGASFLIGNPSNNYYINLKDYGGSGYTKSMYTANTQPDISNVSTPYALQAEMQYTRIIDNITFSPGSGYITTPDVRINTEPAYWIRPPQASVQTMDGDKIQTITIDDAGEGYFDDPNFLSSIQVSFIGGKGDDAVAVAANPVNGEIRSITIDPKGSGYSSKPTVTLQGGGFDEPAQIEDVVIRNGQLEEIIIDGENPGKGYKSAPSVIITGGKGVNATGTATTIIDGRITDINIISSGQGYPDTDLNTEKNWTRTQWENALVTNPWITIGTNTLRPGGKQAFAKVTELDGNYGIKTVELVYTGKGYIAQPTLTLRSNLNPTTPASLSPVFEQDGRLINPQVNSSGSGYTRSRGINLEARSPSEAAADGNKATIIMYGDGELDSSTFRYAYQTSMPRGNGKFRACVTRGGDIWAIPYNTYRILKMTLTGNNVTLTNVFLTDGSDFGKDTDQFISLLGDPGTNVLYGIPEKKRKVLKIDATSNVTYVTGVEGTDEFQGEWSGAVLSSTTKVIYAVPRNSEYLLCIDTKQDALTRTITFPLLNTTGGTNKFSAVVEESQSNNLVACPMDANAFISISPAGEALLPAPGVKINDNTVVYPPQGSSVLHTTVSASGSVSKTSYSTTGTAVNLSLGDGCLLSDGNVAWVAYYSIASIQPFENRVVLYNPNTHAVSVSNSFDVKYSCCYPSKSVSEVNGLIVWPPAQSQYALVAYDRTNDTLTTLGSRISRSIRFASGITNGNRYIAITPRETSIDLLNNVPGFMSTLGSSAIRYEEAVTSSSTGYVALIAAGNADFRIFKDPENITDSNNSKSIAFTRSGVYGVAMGGGVVSSVNNKVYCVPFNHDRVFILDTEYDVLNDYVIDQGSVNEELWRGAVEDLGNTNLIFGIPWNSSYLIVIDPLNSNPRDALQYIDINEPSPGKWWSGVFSPVSNKIYCVPFNSDKILVITPGEPVSWTTIDITSVQGSQATNKWCRGCIGPDKKIYCSPWSHDSILVIDPADDTVSTIPIPTTGNSKYSNVIHAPNGKLYFIPNFERSVLEYDVFENRFLSYGDFGNSTSKHHASIFVPSRQEIMAFHNYDDHVKTILPSSQHLIYSDGTSVQTGRDVNGTTEFRLRPKVDVKGILFHSLDTLARLPDGAVPETPLSYTPSVPPGILGLQEPNGGSDPEVITVSNDWFFTTVLPDEGGICGAISFSRRADFYSGIRGTSFYSRFGDSISSIPFIFEPYGVYRNSVVGPLSSFSDSKQIYSFFLTNLVNRTGYTVFGDSGSIFSIGRIFGQGYSEVPNKPVPEVSTTLNGLLSECIIFKNTVLEHTTRFGADQQFYFIDTTNLALSKF